MAPDRAGVGGPVGDSGEVSRPVPDPTALTTAAQERAIDGVRDYVDGQIAVVAERLRGIDRANQVLSETVNRVPTDLQLVIGHLRELMDERASSDAKQFALLERGRVEQKSDTGKAVDAALAAAKELAGAQAAAFALETAKAEKSMSEQLRQLSATFTTALGGMNKAQDDLKDRVQRIEYTKVGGQEKLTGIYAALAAAVAIIALIVFAASGAFSGGR